MARRPQDERRLGEGMELGVGEERLGEAELEKMTQRTTSPQWKVDLDGD